MNDNHNEDEAPFDGTSEDSTLEDQMSAHIAAIAASGVAAEAEALANRQADMAARERRETRLAILAAIAIIGAFAICVIKTLKKNIHDPDDNHFDKYRKLKKFLIMTGYGRNRG